MGVVFKIIKYAIIFMNLSYFVGMFWMLYCESIMLLDSQYIIGTKQLEKFGKEKYRNINWGKQIDEEL